MGGGGALTPPAAAAVDYSFVDIGKVRAAKMPLEWPVRAPDGRIVDTLQLRRLKGSEVAIVQDAMMTGNEAGMLALFVGEPVEMINALDQDDLIELKKRVVDFLPRSLRDALEAAQAEMLDPAKFPTGDV